MLKATVKAGSVTHLTDARYFAAWEVDYLGFDLSPAGISALEFTALREWIAGPQLIGEIELLVDGQLPEGIEALHLDGIQFSELVDFADIALLTETATLKSQSFPLIFQEYVVQGYQTSEDVEYFLRERAHLVSNFILNFNKGGINWQDLEEGTPFDVTTLAGICSRYPVLIEIEGALPTAMQAQLPHLKGFSLRGGEEEKVGFKDFDGLGDFFEDLEE